MDIWDHIGAGVEARLETDLLPALYAATALETAAIRATLTSQDLPWVDPDRASIPPLEELSVAGEILVAQARKEAAGIGAAGGIAGAVGAPPEAMAAIIHCMRLGQKLCVLYGHDPETGQGHVTLWRCIGVAYELELPEEMEVKLRQLPQAAAMQLPAVRELAHWVLKRAVRRAVMGHPLGPGPGDGPLRLQRPEAARRPGRAHEADAARAGEPGRAAPDRGGRGRGRRSSLGSALRPRGTR